MWFCFTPKCGLVLDVIGRFSAVSEGWEFSPNSPWGHSQSAWHEAFLIYWEVFYFYVFNYHEASYVLFLIFISQFLGPPARRAGRPPRQIWPIGDPESNFSQRDGPGSPPDRPGPAIYFEFPFPFSIPEAPRCARRGPFINELLLKQKSIPSLP